MLKMTHSERALIDKYILLGIPCMKFLKEDVTTSETEAKYAAFKQASSDQYKDVLSYFAAAFTTLDGYDLKRTLGKRLNVLVDAIVDDPRYVGRDELCPNFFGFLFRGVVVV